MKSLLTTLNSKYIHSSLALRYLRQFVAPFPVALQEFTINEPIEDVAAEIHRGHFDLVAMACYIWNIEPTLHLVEVLKRANPQLKIVLGGPEVTYDPLQILTSHPAVDMIVVGEGEPTFAALLAAMEQPEPALESILGLAWRQGDRVIVNADRPVIKDLDQIPFPYTAEDLTGLENRIIYYEASRGCPFNCQYCLSSTLKGVRFFSLARVKRDLTRLMEAGVKQVKFVDRTFNCNQRFALDVWRFLIECAHDLPINFHFEMAADLIDDEMIALLAAAPEGLFQFEIGVQSTNPETLEAIDRRMDFHEVAERVRQIHAAGNIHLHLDLIAGLPHEGWESFSRSFNDVYALAPDQLQLGFLKMLKGSGLRMGAERSGYRYDPHPPYQVISSPSMGFDELIRLKLMEELLERYANSHRFAHSLGYLIDQVFHQPFAFFERFADFWRGQGYDRGAHRSAAYYDMLWRFGQSSTMIDGAKLTQLLKLDFCLHHRDEDLPSFLPKTLSKEQRDQVYALFASPRITQVLPELSHLTGKALLRQVRVEAFAYDMEAVVSGSSLDAAQTPSLYAFFTTTTLRGHKHPHWRRLLI